MDHGIFPTGCIVSKYCESPTCNSTLQEHYNDTKITSLPKILTIHINRINYTNKVRSRFINTHLKINKTLSIKPNMMTQECVSSCSNDNAIAYYKLVGIVDKLGESVAGGHYVAYMKTNSQWIRIDDTHIYAITNRNISDVEFCGCYLIFYKQIQNTENKIDIHMGVADKSNPTRKRLISEDSSRTDSVSNPGHLLPRDNIDNPISTLDVDSVLQENEEYLCNTVREDVNTRSMCPKNLPTCHRQTATDITIASINLKPNNRTLLGCYSHFMVKELSALRNQYKIEKSVFSFILMDISML